MCCVPVSYVKCLYVLCLVRILYCGPRAHALEYAIRKYGTCILHLSSHVTVIESVCVLHELWDDPAAWIAACE
jgi:hypothetical protein